MTIKELIISKEIIEPETINILFPMLSNSDIEKINAARTIIHSRFPFEDFYIFEDIVLALNGESPDFSVLQGCSPEQIFYAVEIIQKLRPLVEFSWECQFYTKMMCNEAGVYFYPLEFTDLENPLYEKVKELAEKNDFNGESIEYIQASKFKAIQMYINKMKHKSFLEWR